MMLYFLKETCSGCQGIYISNSKAITKQDKTQTQYNEKKKEWSYKTFN